MRRSITHISILCFFISCITSCTLQPDQAYDENTNIIYPNIPSRPTPTPKPNPDGNNGGSKPPIYPNDPTPAKIMVENFKKPRTVRIWWQADPSSDEYLLYRSKNYNIGQGSSTLIYKGNNLSYEDTMLDTNDGDPYYYYYLIKRYGNEETEPSDVVMGIASNFIEDFYEPNDIKKQAKELISTIEANIYLYKDRYDNIIEDVDWYHIRIRAKSSAVITISKNGEFGEIEDFDLNVFIEGDPLNPLKATNGTTYYIKNTEFQERDIYFYIMVNHNQFMDRDGYKIGFYVMDLISIQSEN